MSISVLRPGSPLGSAGCWAKAKSRVLASSGSDAAISRQAFPAQSFLKPDPASAAGTPRFQAEVCRLGSRLALGSDTSACLIGSLDVCVPGLLEI